MLNVLTLYSTEGCHLCEMAFDLVGQIGLAEQTHIVDIAFDDVLFSRLRRHDSRIKISKTLS